MKKRIIALFILIAIALSFVSCEKPEPTDDFNFDEADDAAKIAYLEQRAEEKYDEEAKVEVAMHLTYYAGGVYYNNVTLDVNGTIVLRRSGPADVCTVMDLRTSVYNGQNRHDNEVGQISAYKDGYSYSATYVPDDNGELTSIDDPVKERMDADEYLEDLSGDGVDVPIDDLSLDSFKKVEIRRDDVGREWIVSCSVAKEELLEQMSVWLADMMSIDAESLEIASVYYDTFYGADDEDVYRIELTVRGKTVIGKQKLDVRFNFDATYSVPDESDFKIPFESHYVEK